MKIVSFLAQVDESKCRGDKLCPQVCPTGAITVTDKKASVQNELCVACTRCFDRCPEDAITMVPREAPKLVAVSMEEVDETEVRALCLKAHRQPDELVCICTGTFAGEIAAAIIKGARSIREVVRMTGAVSGCQEFCVPVVQRMLKACGVNIAEAGAPLNYDQTFSLWDIPEEISRKYPRFCVKEDAELAGRLRKG